MMPSIFQISSMIEIEVELDSDVLAAEAASNAVRKSWLSTTITWSENRNLIQLHHSYL